MEHLWIIIGLAAATIQTFRSGMMKHLRNTLSDQAIMLARFGFSVPFIALWLVGFAALGYDMPNINGHFFLYAGFAATLQLVGGFFFLALFGRRNFVIGITYSKIEALMVAIFAAALFGEYISTAATIAIITGFVGIALISVSEQHVEPQRLIKRIFSKSGQIGMACGVLFGLCSTYIRQAILALDGGEFFTRAALTLLVMLVIQTIALAIYMAWKDRRKITAIANVKRKALALGLSNSLSSLGWFMAFSLTKAAYVSMLSQLEILFSIFLTHNLFREKIGKVESVGIFLVTASVILLVSTK